jgi:arylsulfatase A-like enzyme
VTGFAGRLDRVATAGALLAGLLASGCDSGGPSPTAPDVLLVVVDTLRVDRTGLLPGGPPTTPSLDALGLRGAAYRQANAPASWTLPSMAALFSGEDVRFNRHAALDGPPALAERFAAGGYRTIGLVANPLLTADNGFARGFEEYTVAPATATADLSADIHALRSWDAEALVSRLLERLRALPDEAPAFLYLHLMDPHVPYDPANERLAAPHRGWSQAPEVPWATQLSVEQDQLLCGWRRAYDGQVTFTDRALGRLLEDLPARRGRPLLVAVTSDHGEGLFSHERAPDSTPGPGPLGNAYPDHGEQLYEEAVRAPLWLAGPGVAPGHDERRPVALRDLGATLLDLAGLDAAGPRLPLSAADPAPEVVMGVGTRGWFARSTRRKLVLPFPERSGISARLHAVEGDRFLPETTDLRLEEAGTASALEALLRAWIDAGDRPADRIDPATEERLRALGYIR